MIQDYIIINKAYIQKRIEDLDNFIEEKKIFVENERCLKHELKQIISKSTPLRLEIEKAIEFGKDIRSEKSFINNNFGSPFLDYEDSTEETNNYISNLKLDI